MLKKYSTIFGSLMVSLFDWEMELLRRSTDAQRKDRLIDEGDKKAITHHLTIATNMSHELGLDAVVPLADRMWDKLNGEYKNTELYRDVADLRSRIEDQLRARFFLFVSPGRLSYYQDPAVFGSDVNDKFPDAISDIEDAGKALALGLGTSCVMHLMRVMEVGLKTLAQSLKISYAPSWEAYLKQIQAKIDTKHKTKGVQWRRDEKYFRDISGDLLTVKQAWRNPTMHIGRRYTVDEAEEVLKAVRALMQRLTKPRI